MLGGLLLFPIDIYLQPGDPLRLILIGLFLAPGTLWFIYTLFHTFRALPAKLRRDRNRLD